MLYVSFEDGEKGKKINKANWKKCAPTPSISEEKFFLGGRVAIGDFFLFAFYRRGRDCRRGVKRFRLSYVRKKAPLYLIDRQYYSTLLYFGILLQEQQLFFFFFFFCANYYTLFYFFLLLLCVGLGDWGLRIADCGLGVENKWRGGVNERTSERIEEMGREGV
jgi:hypothetical protein